MRARVCHPAVYVFSAVFLMTNLLCAQTMSHLDPEENKAGSVERTLSLPMTGPGFTVRQAGRCEVAFRPRHAGAVEVVIEECDEAVSELARQLGPRSLPTDSVRVRIEGNTRKMALLAPPGAPPPPWADAVAYPEIGLILLSLTTGTGVSRPPLGQVLRHEISHLLLRRAAGHNELPKWFVEGVAIVQAQEASLARFRLLAGAVISGRLLSLSQMRRTYPRREWEINLAYAQAAELVSELVEKRGGWGPVRQLLKKVRSGVSFYAAFAMIYGESAGAFAYKWSTNLKKRLNILPVISGSAFLWTLMAFLLIWGYVRKSQEKREKLAAMAAEEAGYDEALDRLEKALDDSRDKPLIH